MKRLVHRVALLCTIAGLVFARSVPTGQDEVVAQQSVPTLTRMFTGSDGLTHFEEIPMPVGKFIKVAGVQFNRPSTNAKPNPPVLDWHTAPHRRYVITLSGRAEIVGSADNTLFVADRDHMLLAEDVTGKGHTTKGIDWVSVFVEIEEPSGARSN
jgi:hypothetical protein